ncbi:MAG: heat-inducible transcriptional repressor HrcA [Clostridia bacterium]
MKLDDRKFMILKAIIDDYILTAVPVGSRTISRKGSVAFSPATIRNEMSDLEELGYLDQPHTSAGRIPSPKAYRLYVDHLVKISEISQGDAQQITQYLDMRSRQVEDVIKRAAQVLSDMTQYTSLITSPQSESLRVKRIQLVPVSENTALLIVVTNAGIIKDAVVRVPDDFDEDQLYELSLRLSAQLDGLTMSQVRQKFAEIFRDLNQNRKLLAALLGTMEDRIGGQEHGDMVVGGSANLLNYPEYADVEKVKAFLGVLESREKLYPLLRQAGAVEFTIHIGPENDLPELQDCSLVTASYRVGNHSTGTMGIIGPTRMNYAKVVSVLSFMGRAITDMLSEK